MQEIEEASVDLRGMLTLVRRRIVWILFTTAIVGAIGAAYIFFVDVPTYTASTQLVVKLPESTALNSNYAGTVTGNIQMTTTINQVIVSPVILKNVQKKLNLSQDIQKNVSARSLANSQVITITVKYNDPSSAEKIANETAKIFSKKAPKILNVTNVSILSKARINKNPINFKPKLYLLISIAIGLVVGVALSLLIELLNNKIAAEEDIERLGFFVLGSISYANESHFLNRHLTSKKTREATDETSDIKSGK